MMEKLAIPPGVYRNATEYSAGARWYDVNLVRWIDGLMQPVGGWQQFHPTAISGACRGLFSWKSNNSASWLAIGTSSNLYIHDTGGLFDITPAGFTAGLTVGTPGLGWGIGDYGEGTYGTARPTPSGLILDAATWSFDTFGEYLLACSTSDGKIWEWLLVTANDATQVTNAPTSCRGVFVSDQRHVVALGAGGDPRKIQWSHFEDRNLWTPAATNQAGDWLLNTTGIIRCALKTRGENLILTSTDAHVMRYIGSPYVFSFDRVGTKCGVAGPNAAVAIDGGAIWMGPDARIYTYDGAVRQVPCDVQQWLDEEFKKIGQSEVYAGTLAERGEVWWFFPTATVTRYLIFNYRTGIWSNGTLDRFAWLDRGVWAHPVAVSSTGLLYEHENGQTDSGDTRVGTIYAESGALELANGEAIVDVVQLLPDEKTRGDLTVTFKAKYTPNGAETTFGPYAVRSDGYTDTRASGRQMKLRVAPVTDNAWQWGTPRADIRFGGSR